MECPKCRHSQGSTNTECTRCGLIFERYRELPARTLSVVRPRGRFRRMLDYLLHVKPGGSAAGLYGRSALLLFLFIWSGWFVLSPMESNYAGRSFMHLVNLPFHEAGHVLTRPLGSFMNSLGGSLGQVVMPLVCMCVLLFRTRDTFGASIGLWWMGESFIDLAPYIDDARSLSLPLLGGNTGYSAPYGFHDWQFILNEAGLLDREYLIADLSQFLGTILILTALAWGGSVLFREWRQGNR